MELIPQTLTSRDFQQAVSHENGTWLPWKTNGWSDSEKEQYFNMLNAEAANERELEMWRLNNEYNTPAAQMQRMIEAGINPAAAYSQVSSGNASSAPGTHKVDSVKWHDTTDKLAKQKLVLESVNDFVKTFGDLLNNAFAIPQQVSQNRISNLQYTDLKNAQFQKQVFANRIFKKGSLEYNDAVNAGQDLLNLGNDFFTPSRNVNAWNLPYYQNFIDMMQRNDTKAWLQEQRDHLKTMFADEESRVAADASMREWLEKYKETIPPEYRYFLDILLQLLQIGAPRGSYHLGISKSQRLQ